MNRHATHNSTMDMLNESITRLLDYCKRNEWAGFDPFDGLNSRLFSLTPFRYNKICRLSLTQLLKRLPINLRRLLLVPKEQNPKGLALFASALIKLSELELIEGPELINSLLNRLIDLRTPESQYFCWGYNFDWQNRSMLLPRFSPNIICTSFSANALLDAYEKTTKTEFLDMAVSAGHFILKGLNITKDDNGICFSYTTHDNGQVHNANLLGAALLARLYSITKETSFLDFALQAIKFSVDKQNSDGSWFYGEDKTQRWVDNFHTGYNLVALNKFCEYTGNHLFIENIKKGYNYYKKYLFTTSSIPKYYHDRIYPIDIHSISQSIITPVELFNIDKTSIKLSESVCMWALKNMQSKDGYFYYRKGRFFKNKISYMRWSQAWMLLALSTLMEQLTSLGHR